MKKQKIEFLMIEREYLLDMLVNVLEMAFATKQAGDHFLEGKHKGQFDTIHDLLIKDSKDIEYSDNLYVFMETYDKALEKIRLETFNYIDNFEKQLALNKEHLKVLYDRYFYMGHDLKMWSRE